MEKVRRFWRFPSNVPNAMGLPRSGRFHRFSGKCVAYEFGTGNFRTINCRRRLSYLCTAQSIGKQTFFSGTWGDFLRKKTLLYFLPSWFQYGYITHCSSITNYNSWNGRGFFSLAGAGCCSPQHTRAQLLELGSIDTIGSVSYTHLTLPTIYSV